MGESQAEKKYPQRNEKIRDGFREENEREEIIA